MARIRTIKPEFWTDEAVMDLPLGARLLFIGMWNFADDEGRLPLKPRTIKAQVLPGDDDVTPETVRYWLSLIAHGGLIELYVNSGREYVSVHGWHHQRINRPTPSKYPGPLDKGSRSLNPHGGLTEDSPPDLPYPSGRGSTQSAREEPPLPPEPDELPELEPDDGVCVWRMWEEEAGTPKGSPRWHGDLRTIANECRRRDPQDWQSSCRRLIASWLADPWVAENRPPIRHLATRMDKYLPASGPPSADEFEARWKAQEGVA